LKLIDFERNLAEIDKRLAEYHFQKIMIGTYKGEFLERMRAKILLEVLYYLKDRSQVEIKEEKFHYWLREAIISQIENSDSVMKLRKEMEENVLQYWSKQTIGYAERQEILEKSSSRKARKEVWSSILPLVKLLSGPFTELVKRRNKEAQRWGFGDYAELILNLNKLQKKGVVNLCLQLLGRTNNEYFRNLNEMRRKINLPDIAPWDIEYLFSFSNNLTANITVDLEPSSFLNLFFQKLGWRLQKMPIEIKYHKIPYGGLCFNFIFDRKSIILLNPQRAPDLNTYIILAHEIAHALQNVLVKKSVSYIDIISEPSFIKEGTAEFIGYLVLDKDILCSLHSSNIKEQILRTIYRYFAQKRRVWLRRQAVDAIFEINLYQFGPERAENMYNTIARKYLGIDKSSHSTWLADIIFCSHPIYLYNYILAEDLKAKIERKLQKMGIPFLSQRTGKWLQSHFFSTSGEVPWIQKVKGIWSSRYLKRIILSSSYESFSKIQESSNT